MPDVILMDIDMPKMNGIDATTAICGRHPEIRVIGLSMYEDEQSVQRMRQAGAVDYVTKSSAASLLLAAIRRNRRPPPTDCEQ
jgi:DNA-binding NarL/FixJ family response regulator